MALFCVGLIGCGSKPTHDPKFLKTLAREGEAVLEGQRSDYNLDVPETKRPKSIKSLEPLSVLTTRDGLYISTDSFFVMESGYFVPRKNAQVDTRKSLETTFSPLGYGVYWYHTE
jgi:hypothetical protein